MCFTKANFKVKDNKIARLKEILVVILNLTRNKMKYISVD